MHARRTHSVRAWVDRLIREVHTLFVQYVLLVNQRCNCLHYCVQAAQTVYGCLKSVPRFSFDSRFDRTAMRATSKRVLGPRVTACYAHADCQSARHRANVNIWTDTWTDIRERVKVLDDRGTDVHGSGTMDPW